MKKLKTLMVVLLSALLLLLPAGCSGKLETPVGFYLDENDTLMWSDVPNARSYRVEITPADGTPFPVVTVHRASYTLSGDSMAVGDYTIRVMAVGGNKNSLSSDWSEPQPYRKEENYGLLYRLIDGGTAYEVYRIGSSKAQPDEPYEVRIGPTYGTDIGSTNRKKPVTRIAEKALRAGRDITSIYIDDSVREIGSEAFANCTKLTSVRLPEHLKSLGYAAFQGCGALTTIENLETAEFTEIGRLTFAYCRSLPSVELPEGITYIDSNAFYACEAITDLQLPAALTEIGSSAFSAMTSLARVGFGAKIATIGNAAFSGDKALETLEFAPLEGELEIGETAFSATGFKNVALPAQTTEIGAGAFMNCADLAGITIPETVTDIGYQAFLGCGFLKTQNNAKGLYYADHWLVGVSEEVKPTLTEIDTGDFREGTVGIASGALNACPSLINVDSIPDGVIYLGDYGFSNCPQLTKVITQDNSLVYVGDYAFAACPILSNVQFGNGLKSIGNYAFYGCAMLNNNLNNPDVLVPNSVEHIGIQAFLDTGLAERPEGGIIYANNWAVGHSGRVPRAATLREDTRGISDYAFYPLDGDDDCLEVTGFANMNRVVYIGAGAFCRCESLTSVSFSRDLRVINPYAFAYCSSLVGANFPSRLTRIGHYAFMGCTELLGIDLSNTEVQTVDPYAFYNCEWASEIKLGESLETIGTRAFFNIGHTTELTIPDSVTSIGAFAFAYGDLVGDDAWMMESQLHSSLTDLTIGENVTSIGEGAFRNNTRLVSVEIPDSVTSIGAQAFYNCTGLSEVKFGAAVETIGRYAFSHTALQEISIPATVKSIDDFAFADTKLSGAFIPATVETLGSHVFYNDPSFSAYIEATSRSEGWNIDWNSGFRPVFWGSALDETGSYVGSVVTGGDYAPQAGGTARGGIENDYMLVTIAGPVRAGYEFLGWATSPNATEPLYGAKDQAALTALPAGTRLYTVWKVREEEGGGSTTPPEDAGDTGTTGDTGAEEIWLGEWPKTYLGTLGALPPDPVAMQAPAFVWPVPLI